MTKVIIENGSNPRGRSVKFGSIKKGQYFYCSNYEDAPSAPKRPFFRAGDSLMLKLDSYNGGWTVGGDYEIKDYIPIEKVTITVE